MMKQNKNNLSDLLVQVQQLNEKYQIKDFVEEIKSLFKLINIDESNVEEFLKNPFCSSSIMYPLDKIDANKLSSCMKQYHKIKKKYKYDAYVREGNVLRKNFLQQRKNYIFNSNRFIRFTTAGKLSALERLNVELTEQQFIAKWVDKLLKRIYPNTLVIEYEDLDGSVKTAEIQHHKIEYTDEYVHAPLIDRLFGESLFDTFLLHSFYNVKTENYEYFPVKFIIRMKSKDNFSTFYNEE